MLQNLDGALPCPPEDSDNKSSITLTIREFSRCADELTTKANGEIRNEQFRYKNISLKSNPEDAEPSLRASEHWPQFLHNLITDLDYIKETRLSSLPPDTSISIRIADYCAQDVYDILNGGRYELENLALISDWVEVAREAMDHLISEPRLLKMVDKYDAVSRLEYQLPDQEKKAAAVDILRQSLFGRQLWQNAVNADYKVSFTDLRAFNHAQKDRKAPKVVALCNGAHIYFTGRIYVGTDVPRSAISHAISLAHECAHAVQFALRFNAPEYGDQLISMRDEKYASMKEAHSIAAQYIVASELLAAGFDYCEIYQALYDLPPAIVNRLQDDPEGFIAAVSEHDIMRDRWKFKPQQIGFRPEIALAFAQTLPPMQTEWMSFQETVMEGVMRTFKHGCKQLMPLLPKQATSCLETLIS